MKKLIFFLALCFCVGTVAVRPVETYAYTEEEKQMAKQWLSAHGYAPTRAGAEQAYQDYLNGKFDDLIKQYEGEYGKEEVAQEKPKKKKKKKDKSAENKGKQDKNSEAATEAGTDMEAATEIETSEADSEITTADNTAESTEEVQSKAEYEQAKKEQARRKKISLGIIGISVLVVVLGGFFLFFRKEE